MGSRVSTEVMAAPTLTHCARAGVVVSSKTTRKVSSPDWYMMLPLSQLAPMVGSSDCAPTCTPLTMGGLWFSKIFPVGGGATVCGTRLKVTTPVAAVMGTTVSQFTMTTR